MTTITVQVSAGDEDAHQYGGTGTVDPTGNVLNASASNQWVGLAFNAAGLWDIQDTIITSAWLELYFTSGSLDDPDVTIYGYSDPGQWDAFTAVNNQISGLSSTTATVNWTAGGVGTGWKTSPDIKTVIQEIADMSGWIGNSICIVYKGNAGATGMRIRSYEGDSSQAAKLVINYETASSGQPMTARARLVPGMRRPHGSQGW